MRGPIALPMILLFIDLACETTSDAPHAREAPTPPAIPRAPQAPHGPEGEAAPADATPTTGELDFSPPPEWIVETLSSKMRKARYRLPHADGDTEDATVVLNDLGPAGGGGRQANLDRWAGRFEQPDGSDSAGHLKSYDSSIMGYYQDASGKSRRWCRTFTHVDISGTYVAETTPGSGERLRKGGWHMLATIISTRNITGPYYAYAELVGPAATVALWRASYFCFVESAKPIH